MVPPQVAKEVGSRLGVVEEVEWKQRKDDFNYFMRVWVSLPISKLLRKGAFIASSDGECTWVNFKYERLSFFSHYCGLLSHDLRHCDAHFATTKHTAEVKYEYGDFLKATGVGSDLHQGEIIIVQVVQARNRCNQLNFGSNRWR